LDEREDALREALAAARRERPCAYWDGLEGTLGLLLAARRRLGAFDARPGPEPYADFPVECEAASRGRLAGARALPRARRAAEAASLLERLESEDRAKGDLALLRASILVETGEVVAARSIAEADLATRPDDAFALAVLARADVGRARSLLERCQAL